MTNFIKTQSVQSSFFLILLTLCTKLFAGYGDCIDTLPSAYEREVHVMTNAVRMDPVGFRDMYIEGEKILLPENYPAVAPLWYDHNLSRASRFHSINMAQNCGMQHNSCDGTTFVNRLKTFYTASSTIGENIATGKTTGLGTVVQWLRDDVRKGSAYVPAGDGERDGNTVLDGHRKNIMSSNFKCIGAGYAYNANKNYKHFWTQDFGGGKVSDHKIPAGCHFIPTSSTISYAANFYDASDAEPTLASVIIDEKNYPLTLHLGSKGKGTYIYTTANDKKNHCYYFLFIDGSGTQVRFPETVRLTTGTTLCCDEGNSTIDKSRYSNLNSRTNFTNRYTTSTYTLDGTKISGKLQLFYTSGINVRGNSDKNTAAQKGVILNR